MSAPEPVDTEVHKTSYGLRDKDGAFVRLTYHSSSSDDDEGSSYHSLETGLRHAPVWKVEKFFDLMYMLTYEVDVWSTSDDRPCNLDIFRRISDFTPVCFEEDYVYDLLGGDPIQTRMAVNRVFVPQQVVVAEVEPFELARHLARAVEIVSWDSRRATPAGGEWNEMAPMIETRWLKAPRLLVPNDFARDARNNRLQVVRSVPVREDADGLVQVVEVETNPNRYVPLRTEPFERSPEPDYESPGCQFR